MQIEDLLSKGYFPEEITPPFNSRELLHVHTEILRRIDTLDIKKNTKVVPFSIPRIKAYRRNLSIPNPLSFLRLAKTITENWAEIETASGRSKISLSPLSISGSSARALVAPSYDKIISERILRSTPYRYLLRIDIQRFYSSIYTHSIPWVLHGKSVAKGKRKRTDLLGNALDEDLRKMQDGQTIGIPIGPDTSRIISELVVSYIDAELEKKMKYIGGIRIVDDYYLYFKTLSDLELGRSVLHRLLKDLELELNPSKEKVVELPEQFETDWYNRLRDFKFRNDKEKQRKDIISYFDFSFGYSSRFPDDAVLVYSLSKIKATVFLNENWPLLESFLLKSLLIESKILPFVAQMLISHKEEGYDLNVAVIKNCVEDFVLYHLEMDNHFEVTWALWLFKQVRIEVSKNVAAKLSANTNSIIVLTVLDLQNDGLVPVGLDTKLWKSLLSLENLYNENWLLAYEAVVKGWLTPRSNYLSKDPFFSSLQSQGVSFYDSAASLDLSSLKVTSEEISLTEKMGMADWDKIFGELQPEYVSKSDEDLEF